MLPHPVQGMWLSILLEWKLNHASERVYISHSIKRYLGKTSESSFKPIDILLIQLNGIRYHPKSFGGHINIISVQVMDTMSQMYATNVDAPNRVHFRHALITSYTLRCMFHLYF